jgi:riboflavin biosynthesis pyrimidine reductase
MPRHKGILEYVRLRRCDKKENGTGGQAVIVDHDRRMPFPKRVGEPDSGKLVTTDASHHGKTAVLETIDERYIQLGEDQPIETQHALVRIERHGTLHIVSAMLDGTSVNSSFGLRHLGQRIRHTRSG